MADRIKTVSTYNGTSWGSEVPIGADASNVDVTLSNNTKSDLQTVLGSTPSGSSVTERINNKVSISGGDVADTVVSKNINNYDSSTTAGDDILTDTAATMSTNTSTLWSRFNLFRKKVSNNFANYFEKSNLVGSDVGVTSTGDNNTAYTTAAINNYLSNVIGYTSASDIDPDVGSVATQLSTLNNNFTPELIKFRAYLFDNKTLAPNGIGVYTAPVPIDPRYNRMLWYWDINNASSQGQYCSWCYVYRTAFNSEGVSISIRNSSNSLTAKIAVTVNAGYILGTISSGLSN